MSYKIIVKSYMEYLYPVKLYNNSLITQKEKSHVVISAWELRESAHLSFQKLSFYCQ